MPAEPTDPSTVAEASARLERTLFEVKRVIVGQDRMIERLMVCLIARGHCLARRRARPREDPRDRDARRDRSAARSHRIQFTPDLVPSDLVGTRIYRPSTESFDVEWGPVFANFVLADEINRAPAKVQSALLEVMAEGHVSIAGTTHAVPEPVPRARDPEPDRVRRRVPASRGTARPVPHEGRRGVPHPRRGARDRARAWASTRRIREAGAHATGARRPPARRRPGITSTTRSIWLRGAASSSRHASRATTGFDDLEQPTSRTARARARRLGLVAAGRALALIRGRDLRAAPRRLRRRARSAAPPARAVLRGARRRRRRGHDREPHHHRDRDAAHRAEPGAHPRCCDLAGPVAMVDEAVADPDERTA